MRRANMNSGKSYVLILEILYGNPAGPYSNQQKKYDEVAVVLIIGIVVYLISDISILYRYRELFKLKNSYYLGCCCTLKDITVAVTFEKYGNVYEDESPLLSLSFKETFSFISW